MLGHDDSRQNSSGKLPSRRSLPRGPSLKSTATTCIFDSHTQDSQLRPIIPENSQYPSISIPYIHTQVHRSLGAHCIGSANEAYSKFALKVSPVPRLKVTCRSDLHRQPYRQWASRVNCGEDRTGGCWGGAILVRLLKLWRGSLC